MYTLEDGIESSVHLLSPIIAHEAITLSSYSLSSTLT